MQRRIREIAEECSRAKPRVHELSLLDLRPYFEGFLDANWLDRKLHEYTSWASNNSDPTMQRNILHRPLGMNMLVAMIWSARSWEELHTEDASFRPPAGAKRLVHIASSMAVLEYHAGAHLDSAAREYVRQRLQAADQFLGMVHEINAFTYFIKKGAKVEPRFLRKASPQEIIVHWKGHSIPVQCKAKQPGAGRLISQAAFATLAGSIALDAKVAGRRLLVRIGSVGPIRQQDIDFLRHQVSSGVGSGIGPALVTHCGRTFSLKAQPISGHFTVESVRDYLSSFEFHEGMVVGDPAPNGVGYNVDAVIGIDANPEESLRRWRSLHDSIEDGARQLRGGPPGIIAVHYADSVPDFEGLRPGSEPMLRVMGRLMDPRPHLSAVMLSSEPDLQLPESGRPGNVKLYVKKSSWPAGLLGEFV